MNYILSEAKRSALKAKGLKLKAVAPVAESLSEPKKQPKSKSKPAPIANKAASKADAAAAANGSKSSGKKSSATKEPKEVNSKKVGKVTLE